MHASICMCGEREINFKKLSWRIAQWLSAYLTVPNLEFDL